MIAIYTIHIRNIESITIKYQCITNIIDFNNQNNKSNL